MSLLSSYRNTIKSILRDNSIIVTDTNGSEMLKTCLAPGELSTIILIDTVFPDNDCNNYDIVIFVMYSTNTVDAIKKIIRNKYVNNIYLYFYSRPVKSQCSEIISYDQNNKIQVLANVDINYFPVSPHAIVGAKNDVLLVIKSQKARIIATKTAKPVCLKYCDSSTNILVVLDRDYDRIVDKITPWTYESMLHHHDVQLVDNKYDTIFEKIRYIDYYEAINELNKWNEQLKILQAGSYEYERLRELLTVHLDTLNDLQRIIKHNNVYNVSKAEQNAVTRQIKKSEFVHNNLELIDAIYSTEKCTVRDNVDEYHQFIPKIRMLIESLIEGKRIVGLVREPINNFSEIYVYVEDYITYTEVAEIEKLNVKYQHVKIFLLSERLENYWQCLPIERDESFDNKFDIYYYYKIKQNVESFSDIADSINKYRNLQNAYILDNDLQNSELVQLETDIPQQITERYNAINNTKTNNNKQRNDSAKLDELFNTYTKIKNSKNTQTATTASNTNSHGKVVGTLVGVFSSVALTLGLGFGLKQ